MFNSNKYFFLFFLVNLSLPLSPTHALGSLLGRNLCRLYSQAYPSTNWCDDLYRLDGSSHRIYCAIVRMEGSWLYHPCRTRETMSHITRYWISSVCHHLHILWTINIYIGFILENLSGKFLVLVYLFYILSSCATYGRRVIGLFPYFIIKCYKIRTKWYITFTPINGDVEQ